MPSAAAPSRANVSVSPSTASSSSSTLSLDPALRALATSLASPKASSVFLANAGRNFTAEGIAIQREYSDRRRTAALKLLAGSNRTTGGGGGSSSSNSSSSAAARLSLSLPRPNNSNGNATQTMTSFAASGRLPATYGIPDAAMEPAAQVGYEACLVTLSADPPSGTPACSPVTLSAKVERPGGGGPAAGVVVFGDNGVALGPPVPLSAADGTASIRVRLIFFFFGGGGSRSRKFRRE